MESIVWWNLCDGTAHDGENHFNAGLIGQKMEEKPAYQMLDHVINKEWHTECRVETDANGIADWKGLYGDYEMDISIGRTKLKMNTSLSPHSHNEYRISI